MGMGITLNEFKCIMGIISLKRCGERSQHGESMSCCTEKIRDMVKSQRKMELDGA